MDNPPPPPIPPLSVAEGGTSSGRRTRPDVLHALAAIRQQVGLDLRREARGELGGQQLHVALLAAAELEHVPLEGHRGADLVLPRLAHHVHVQQLAALIDRHWGPQAVAVYCAQRSASAAVSRCGR